MKLYRTTRGIFVEAAGAFYSVEAETWDALVSGGELAATLKKAVAGKAVLAPDANTVLAPVVGQEVWAAGVTYFRSRDARIEESKDAGGGSFYDRIYTAERPELFFKSMGKKVVGPGGVVRIRRDAKWSVPEPELALLIDSTGAIVGYTIGNDMSSRDIEGENPLYLPQAKVYDGSCALGPCVLVPDGPLPKETEIALEIVRGGKVVFAGKTSIAEIKREFTELASYLFRESSFPEGVFLMTGTGVVPGDGFTLASGDVVRISIAGIGVLENRVG